MMDGTLVAISLTTHKRQEVEVVTRGLAMIEGVRLQEDRHLYLLRLIHRRLRRLPTERFDRAVNFRLYEVEVIGISG